MKFRNAIYALVVSILMPACKDDNLIDGPESGDNVIKYSTSIFAEIPMTRSNDKSRYSSFKVDKVDNSGIYLLTAVENKIELPTKTDTEKSRGELVSNDKFGTKGYNKMQLFAYTYSDIYDHYHDAWENSAVKPYILNGVLNLTKDGSDTKAASEKEYRWTNSRSKLTFFSVFPADINLTGTDDEDGQSSDNWPTITYTVPTDINDHQDIMYAKSDDYLGDGTTCDYTAELPMKHALTAVSVELSTGFESRVITNVTFSSIQCYGYYSLGNDEGWSLSQQSPDSRSASYNIADNVTNMHSDGNVFMMIPQTLDDDATISITVYNTVTGKEKTFTASIAGGEWEMGSTAHYKLSTDDKDVDYYFELDRDTMYFSYNNTAAGYGEETFTCNNGAVSLDKSSYLRIKSYKATTEIANGEVITSYERVSWTAAATGNTSAPSDDGLQAIRTTDDTTDWGYIVRPQFSSANAGYTRTSDENQKLATNSATTVGTSASPIDLTLYYPDGTYRGDGLRNSANCYIINYPGYYEIPVVCGGSIRNNSNATDMYKLGTSSSNAMQTLKNYNNASIPSNWINFAALGAFSGGYQYFPKADGGSSKVDTFIEWQDCIGLVNLTYNYTRKTSSDEFYIRFNVSKDNFTQGNAVISVINASDLILWSYHIWVTPYTQDDTFTAQSNQGEEQTFLKVPLGFIAEDIKCYDERRASITFTQKDSGKTATVELVQEYHEFQARSATYYQWGRKDPFPGAKVWETGYLSSDMVYEITFDEKDLYNTDGEGVEVKFTSASGITEPGLGIQNPLTFYYGHRFPDRSYFDLWGCLINVSASTQYPGSIDAGMSSRKTVYDPSPAGFKVPPFYAMPAITTDGLIQIRPNYTSYDVINASEESLNNLSKNGYIDFYKNKTSKSGDTYRLYALGSRLSTTSAGTEGGNIENVGKDGCFWSCTRWVSDYTSTTGTRMFSLRYSNLDFYSPWCNTDTYGYCVLPIVGW